MMGLNNGDRCSVNQRRVTVEGKPHTSLKGDV